MLRMTTFRNIAVTLGLALMCRCGVTSIAGGTSTSENGRMAGIIVNRSGLPTQSTQVRLFPAHYDPIKSNAVVPTDTTRGDGRYNFAGLDSGSYNVVSVNLVDGTRGCVNGIHVAADTIMVPVDTLQIPGTIKLVLPNGLDATYGYFYVPGTSNDALLSDNSGYVLLDSVPSGVSISIYYAAKGSPGLPQLVRDNVIVAPGGVITVDNIGWSFSKKIVLNTTASGAGVAGTVMNFPVLVRLSSNNFYFSQARASGEDIRFTKSDGTPLPYEIERWDVSQSSAEIWVKVDTVYGNDSTHFINMYWGASTGSATVSLSNGAAVFDTANGFQAVWHLQEPAGAVATDATVNHFDGTPSASAPPAAAGVIGTGKHFDGVDQSFEMAGTGTSKLTFTENGHYSLSAWVYVDTLVDSTAHLIVGKGHRNYYLKQYTGWEFTEFHARSGWEIAYYVPPSARSWKYLVGVRDGSSQYLYLDGQLVFTTSGYTPGDTLPRDTTSDVSIGRYLDVVTEFNQGYAFFDGVIDEVRILNIAPSADRIKLCYMNQKEPDALLKW